MAKLRGDLCEFKRWIFFSKLDLSEAYLQVHVVEVCSEIMAIKTHKGLYKFNRLPFIIKVALATVQDGMDTMLEDCDFAVAYLDDILKVFVRKTYRSC